MSGVLVTVVPPAMYDFASLTNTNGITMTFVVASRIDTTGAESGVLQVRAHTITLTNSGDRIDVDVSLHGYTPDDPGTDYGQVGASMANVNFLAPLSPGAPLYKTTALTGRFGGQLKVTVKATRGNNMLTALQAKLSIDLMLKTGGAARYPMARLPGTFLGYA